MSSISSLPAFAEEQGWMVTLSDPDFFGDQRMAASNGFGDVVRVTFSPAGKVISAYLRPKSGTCWWRTESSAEIDRWLTEMNGEML